jgi:hypothetical protein
MEGVVPQIFEEEEDQDLAGDRGLGRKWHLVRGDAHVFGKGMEAPDLRQFDGKVGEQDQFGALCLAELLVKKRAPCPPSTGLLRSASSPATP